MLSGRLPPRTTIQVLLVAVLLALVAALRFGSVNVGAGDLLRALVELVARHGRAVAGR